MKSLWMEGAFTNEISLQYPSHIKDRKYPIASIRDLTTGIDTAQSDGLALLPASKSGQMITFSFENGVVITLRTSGTEPKIKYYAEMCARPDEKYAKSINKSNLIHVFTHKLFHAFIAGIGAACRRHCTKWLRPSLKSSCNQMRITWFRKATNESEYKSNVCTSESWNIQFGIAYEFN